MLLALRHAKSSWSDPSLADHDRPLKKRGKRDAPRMGRLAAEKGLLPDTILSSSARRAVDTARRFADAAGYDGDVVVTEALYHAEPEDYLEALRAVGDPAHTVMVVGHNPGLEMLVEDVTGTWERMPTAALAHVDLPIDTWSELGGSVRGTMVALWRPKEIADR
jgi:phosphohistidine phosphatase